MLAAIICLWRTISVVHENAFSTLLPCPCYGCHLELAISQLSCFLQHHLFLHFFFIKVEKKKVIVGFQLSRRSFTALAQTCMVPPGSGRAALPNAPLSPRGGNVGSWAQKFAFSQSPVKVTGISWDQTSCACSRLAGDAVPRPLPASSPGLGWCPHQRCVPRIAETLSVKEHKSPRS